MIAPTETPAPQPSPTVDQDKRKSASSQLPTPVIQPENPTANQGPARSDSDNTPGEARSSLPRLSRNPRSMRLEKTF